jgi:hypothetical protein
MQSTVVYKESKILHYVKTARAWLVRKTGDGINLRSNLTSSTYAVSAYMSRLKFATLDIEKIGWISWAMLGTTQLQECKAILSSTKCITAFRILICLIIYLLKNTKAYPHIFF